MIIEAAVQVGHRCTGEFDVLDHDVAALEWSSCSRRWRTRRRRSCCCPRHRFRSCRRPAPPRTPRTASRTACPGLPGALRPKPGVHTGRSARGPHYLERVTSLFILRAERRGAPGAPWIRVSVFFASRAASHCSGAHRFDVGLSAKPLWHSQTPSSVQRPHSADTLGSSLQVWSCPNVHGARFPEGAAPAVGGSGADWSLAPGPSAERAGGASAALQSSRATAARTKRGRMRAITRE